MKKVTVPTIMAARIKAKEGEWIEEKVRRVVENGEPIEDGAPIVYTERKDGVQPEYNIRTDKWYIAQHAMDTLARGTREKRKEKQEADKQVSNSKMNAIS